MRAVDDFYGDGEPRDDYLNSCIICGFSKPSKSRFGKLR